MKKQYIGLTILACLLVACNTSNERTLTSATGSIYECLVVIPDKALTQQSLDAITELQKAKATGSAYDEPIATEYDLVKSIMGEQMPCMPQAESYFTLMRVSPGSFDDYLKPTRNILIVDIDAEKYTQTKAKTSVDVWAKPQAVYRIQAPSEDEFVAYWLTHGEEIRDWFVRQEIARQIRFYRANTNKEARAALQNGFGCDMLIPEDYMLLMDTTLTHADEESVHLLWCCNNKGSMRRDIVVYSYPYTDAEMFTIAPLNKKRDDVLSRVITASVPGSYMGTEYRIFPPQMRNVQSLDPTQKGSFYANEIRGLWKIKNGEAMGGPYVSLTRLDPIQGRVVTAETFVFAAGQKKRTALRQSEAILYTLTFPSDTIH